MSEYEFTDRYEATGTPYLDPKTVCYTCEGMGCVPVRDDEEEEPFRTLWLEAEARDSTDDRYHFVVCPACNGTRKRTP